MLIECNCGNWEELPDDEQRWHVELFQFLHIEGDMAHYKCKQCGAILRIS